MCGASGARSLPVTAGEKEGWIDPREIVQDPSSVDQTVDSFRLQCMNSPSDKEVAEGKRATDHLKRTGHIHW